MKITKFQGIVHGIFAIVFTIVYFLVFKKSDFGTWSFWICTMLTLIDTLVLCGYSNKTHAQGSEMMDYALFVPPIAAYLVIIYVAVKVPGIILYQANIYLAILVVIFAVSIMVQILLIRARKGNIKQETVEQEGRFERDNLAKTWEKIGSILEKDNDLYSISKKLKMKSNIQIRYRFRQWNFLSKKLKIKQIVCIIVSGLENMNLQMSLDWRENC